MNLTFRTLAIGVGVMGIAMGVAFGAGVAYGRGDPKTVQSGLTQQQIQQLYGAPTNPGAAAGASAGAGQAGAGGGSTTGPGGGAAALAARSTSGRVTSVSGQTLTIDTPRGSQKVNLSPSASVNKISSGAASDLTEGSTIFASGTRKDDGSFDATSVSQVPGELAQLLSTLTSGGAGGAPASATPTR